MSELLMCAKCTDGEIVEFYLQNLLDAKWNTDGETLRLPASTYGDVSIISETIQASSDADAIIKVFRLDAEVEKLKADLSVCQDQNCEYLLAENKYKRQDLEIERYRTALSHYANGENWCIDDMNRKYEHIWLHNSDGYDIAREAMALRLKVKP
jgi:hypothetical protein